MPDVQLLNDLLSMMKASDALMKKRFTFPVAAASIVPAELNAMLWIYDRPSIVLLHTNSF